MTQQNLFPGLAPSMRQLKGDCASSAQNYLWVIEKQDASGAWYPVRWSMTSRSNARGFARGYRRAGSEVRVVPYKACIDTKGRHNRQITSERLDA